MPPAADLAPDLTRFGLSAFRPGQEQVVRALLAGRSAVAIFPTGGGKSLCYQLPALRLAGLTLVVSPLLALMKDQLDALGRLGVPAGRLDSTLSSEEYRGVSGRLRSGELKLLYVSPERLGNERFVATLRGRAISMVAIDEAHCLSEWGHNFRPDYLRLPELCRTLRAERVLALTATATPEVAGEVAAAFEVELADVVRAPLYRPNLKLMPNPTAPARRAEVLLGRLGKRPPGATIVYCTTQRTTEEVAAKLAAAGHPAAAYHAGMEAAEREATQDRFMTEPNRIVVATIAFGMGIDKPDLRYVYHHDLPKSLENYAQEIGRAGRDGADAVCECLGSAADAPALMNFAHGDAPTPEALAAVLDEVLAAGDEFDLSTYETANRADMKQIVLETLLTYLELDGLLQPLGVRWSEASFQPHKPSAEIFAGFDEDRKRFLSGVFRQAEKKKVWFSLDLDGAAAATGSTRERVLAALSFLEERGDLTLKLTGPRRAYRKKEYAPARDQLLDGLVRRFEQRERREVERVGRMVQFVSDPGCTTRALLAHFGEDPGGPCGHCGPCRGMVPKPAAAGGRTAGPAEEAVVREAAELNAPALAHPRQLTRFLCGLPSPATTKAKLGKHALFGRLEGVPFDEVLSLAESALGA